MAVSSFAHLLLQAAYGDYQIGTFENFHQTVEDTLMVLRPRPKVFFQYELRFANRLKSDLLIGHICLPIKQTRQPKEGSEKSRRFWEISPGFLNYLINFCFNGGAAAPDRDAPWVHTPPRFQAAAPEPARL